jgi:hypothetical protein
VLIRMHGRRCKRLLTTVPAGDVHDVGLTRRVATRRFVHNAGTQLSHHCVGAGHHDGRADGALAGAYMGKGCGPGNADSGALAVATGAAAAPAGDEGSGP